MKNKILLLAVLGVALIVVGVMVNKSGIIQNGGNNVSEVEGDPLDTANNFYNDWLDALLSTTTDPYTLGLQNSDALIPEVQQYIIGAQNEESLIDPVLCLESIPPRVGAKKVFVTEDKAQYLLLPRGIGGVSPQRAVVDVGVIDNTWKITSIDCVNGESAPEREFTFERNGYLLKTDEPPLDPNNWYLVFEENGIDGHHAPLFFSESSECTSGSGEVFICDPNSFANPAAATVKGEMTEAGVEVASVEFN